MTLQYSSFVIRRDFDVPVARLWEAWTTPEFGRWVWAGVGEFLRCEIDLRVGGAYSATMQSPEQYGWHTSEFSQSGIYLHVEAQRRLAYTLHWGAPVGYNQGDHAPSDEGIVVSFSAEGDRSRVEFQHFGIPDDGMSAAEHEKGERVMLQVLEKHLQG